MRSWTKKSRQKRPSLWKTRGGSAALVSSTFVQKILSKPSTQLSPEEYHNTLERQRKYQDKLKQKWITPKNLVIGVVILSFDFAILQLLPYLVRMVGIHDQVLLGKWLIGLVGVVTVATLIYIFTSED
jgi:hypothetical protein